MIYFTNGKFGSGPAPEGFGSDWGIPAPPGYSLADALGVSFVPVITLYAQEDTSKDGPAWMAEISDGNIIEWIGISTLRDVMDLMTRWAPVATASILSYLCDVITGADVSNVVPRLIASIRADDREGVIDQAEADILAIRREGRRAWMARQASPAAAPAQESPEQAANGQVRDKAAQDSETAG